MFILIVVLMCLLFLGHSGLFSGSTRESTGNGLSDRFVRYLETRDAPAEVVNDFML